MKRKWYREAGNLFEDGFGPWRPMSLCFLNFVVVFFRTYFRFRLVKPIVMKICEAPCLFKIITFFKFFVFGAPFVMAHGASLRQYYWRRGDKGPLILVAEGASVRQ